MSCGAWSHQVRAPSCSFRKSRSRPKRWRGCGACSATRWRCCTRGCRTASALTPGGRCGAASGAWPWDPAQRCSLRSSGSGRSWWTKSTSRATSRARHRGTTLAMYLQGPSCGDVRACPRCAIALTVHQTPAALRCHYCSHEEPVPTVYQVCGKETERMRGLGTQQLEHFVGLRFPEARIARMDLDTTSTKWAHHRILERMAEGRLDILLGTQMIAKGLDFPNVTVVGVVDADTGLNLPDFRA